MDQEKIGKFIKEIRKKNNLTQKEFADKLGVTFQAVSKWENGKNIPDIAILKDISNIFSVNIDEILDGEIKDNKTNRNNIYLIIGGIIIVVLLVILFIYFHRDSHDFEFKQISTSCDNFNITGSMAYNKDKTSLYISSVEFCGSDDNVIYDSISCSLYENYNGDEKEISSCDIDNDVSLKEYLKDVSISVDGYNLSCKNTASSDMYLLIDASLDNNKNVVYKIPITMQDNCSY